MKLFHHFTSFNISHLTFISVTSGLCHLAHIVPESENDFIPGLRVMVRNSENNVCFTKADTDLLLYTVANVNPF